MQTAAPVGSIAVTETTRKLCEGYFTLKPLGPTQVKGVAVPVNVYEVTGLGPLRRGFSARRDVDTANLWAGSSRWTRSKPLPIRPEAAMGKLSP